MLIRQLSPHRFAALRRDLLLHAVLTPLDAACTAALKMDGVEYAVKVQLDPNCTVAVLQALRIDRHISSPEFQLITEKRTLAGSAGSLACQGRTAGPLKKGGAPAGIHTGNIKTSGCRTCGAGKAAAGLSAGSGEPSVHTRRFPAHGPG